MINHQIITYVHRINYNSSNEITRRSRHLYMIEHNFDIVQARMTYFSPILCKSIY